MRRAGRLLTSLAVVAGLAAGVAALRRGAPVPAPPPPEPPLAADPELATVPADGVVRWSALLRGDAPPVDPVTGLDAELAAWDARAATGRYAQGDPDRVWAVGTGLLVRAWAVAEREPAAGVAAMGRVVAMGEALRDRETLDDGFVGLALEGRALRELTEAVDTWPGDVEVLDAALTALAGLAERPPRLHRVVDAFCAQQAAAAVSLADPERILGLRFADLDLPAWTGGLLFDRDDARAEALAWCRSETTDWARPRWERTHPAWSPRWVEGTWSPVQYLDNPVGRQVEDRFAAIPLDERGVEAEDAVRAALAVVTAGLVARRLDADPTAAVPPVPPDPWNGRPLQRHEGALWSAARAGTTRSTAPLTWTVPPGATVGVDLGRRSEP